MNGTGEVEGRAADRFEIAVESLPKWKQAVRTALAAAWGLLSWGPAQVVLTEIVVRDRQQGGAKVGTVTVGSNERFDDLLDRIRRDAQEMQPEPFAAAWGLRGLGGEEGVL